MGERSAIGKVIAIALGQAGADVGVNDLRGEDNAVVDEICRGRSNAYAHRMLFSLQINIGSTRTPYWNKADSLRPGEPLRRSPDKSCFLCRLHGFR